MTFNAMSQWWTGWLYPIRLTFRRLPSVASGQYYEDHDGVFNRAGSTLAVPLLGPVNGVHLIESAGFPSKITQSKIIEDEPPVRHTL